MNDSSPTAASSELERLRANNRALAQIINDKNDEIATLENVIRQIGQTINSGPSIQGLHIIDTSKD